MKPKDEIKEIIRTKLESKIPYSTINQGLQVLEEIDEGTSLTIAGRIFRELIWIEDEELNKILWIGIIGVPDGRQHDIEKNMRIISLGVQNLDSTTQFAQKVLPERKNLEFTVTDAINQFNEEAPSAKAFCYVVFIEKNLEQEEIFQKGDWFKRGKTLIICNNDGKWVIKHTTLETSLEIKKQEKFQKTINLLSGAQNGLKFYLGNYAEGRYEGTQLWTGFSEVCNPMVISSIDLFRRKIQEEYLPIILNNYNAFKINQIQKIIEEISSFNHDTLTPESWSKERYTKYMINDIPEGLKHENIVTSFRQLRLFSDTEELGYISTLLVIFLVFFIGEGSKITKIAHEKIISNQAAYSTNQRMLTKTKNNIGESIIYITTLLLKLCYCKHSGRCQIDKIDIDEEQGRVIIKINMSNEDINKMFKQCEEIIDKNHSYHSSQIDRDTSRAIVNLLLQSVRKDSMVEPSFETPFFTLSQCHDTMIELTM
jgi:hypothetical protein